MTSNYERCTAPERTDDNRVLGFEDDAILVGQLGLDGGAQNASTLETFERLFFLEDFSWHER